MGDDRSRSRSGIYAAVTAVAITIGLGIAGAAGADQAAPAHISVSETNGPCFTTTEAKPACDDDEVADVSISTGESVTWHFDGSATYHNAESSNDVAADPTWEPYAGEFVNTGSYSRPFNQPGVYTFVCAAHPTTMKGTVTVTGEPIETATSTATATASPPSSPPPDTHPDTPPPGATDDSVKPTVRGVKTKTLRGGVRVRFRLSEPATVTLRVKRGRRVVKSARVQAPAGTRTVTLRGKRLKKGRYKVEIEARDSAGNRSRLATKRVTLRR
jgi:plastocyanin